MNVGDRLGRFALFEQLRIEPLQLHRLEPCEKRGLKRWLEMVAHDLPVAHKRSRSHAGSCGFQPRLEECPDIFLGRWLRGAGVAGTERSAKLLRSLSLGPTKDRTPLPGAVDLGRIA